MIKKHEALSEMSSTVMIMSRLTMKNSLMKIAQNNQYDKIATRKKLYTRREYIPITEEYLKEILSNLKEGKLMQCSPESLKVKDYLSSNDEKIKSRTYFLSIDKNKKQEYKKYYVSNRFIN